jgi:tricarballylate dehydrogenase
MPSVFPAIKANTITELAQKLGLDPQTVQQTITTYNNAVQPGEFSAAGKLDTCSTAGLSPAKSHWARKIDEPPYYGYPLRPGITFTYLSVKVDETARVMMSNGEPTANLYAAGEIMSGNILGQGYLAGFGMTIGCVFGRLAGAGAATHA